MRTVPLIFWSGVAYSILLVVARGVFPSDSVPTQLLVGVPLIVIAFIIAQDLSRRSTNPTRTEPHQEKRASKGDPVQFLTGQISVATRASNSYFENVVRARFKQLLISKIAIETGFEEEKIRRLLSDPKQGQALLRDRPLYELLYGPIPLTRQERILMLNNAIDLIGAWTG